MLYQCQKCNTEYEIEQSGQYQCQCGETFTIDTTQVTTQEAQCPFCKSAIPEDARKCAHCGEWIKGKPEEKKNGTIYILLSFFVGQFGISEFYVGRNIAGATILLLFILSCCVMAEKQEYGLLAIGLIWSVQFISAIISGVPPTQEEIDEYKRNYKPTKLSKFFSWFNWIIVIVFALAFIAYLICLNYGVFDKY